MPSCRLGASCVAFAALLASPSSARAADAPAPAAPHGVLVNQKNGLCLDVAGFDGARGAQVQLYRCDGHPDQTYTLDATGQLINAAQKLCLDAEGDAGGSRAKVQLADCDQKPDQRWSLRARGAGFEVLNAKQGLCLDVKGYDGKERDDVILYACDQKPDQLWRFVGAGPLTLGKRIALYNAAQRRFIRLDGATAGGTEVVDTTMTTPARKRDDGTITTEPPTLSEVLPTGWYFAFFTPVDGGAGQVALRNAASPRYLSAGPGGVVGSAKSDALPADWAHARFTVLDLGDGAVGLFSENAGRFVEMTAKGGLALSAESNPTALPATATAARFVVVTPRAVKPIAPTSSANPTCVAAMSCLLDGALQKAIEPICSDGCDKSKSTVAQLLAALIGNDMPSLCSSGVKAALDITEMALTGFVETMGEEVLKGGICADPNRGSPVCNGDPTCNMKLAGTDPCDPRALAEKWANKLCSLTSYTRDAGVSMTCGSGEEQLGALCYDECPADLNGSATDAAFCRGDCPSGYKDTGLLCTAPIKTAKTEIGSCPSGYTTYPLTCTNWKVVPAKTISRVRCPSGYTDVAGVCSKGGDTVSKPNRARTPKALHACPSGRVKDESGALCYKSCMAGYRGVGPVCWKM